MEGNGSIVPAQSTSREEVAQRQPEERAVLVPVIERLALGMSSIATPKLHCLGLYGLP
jgi:hypothetical protein